MLYAVQAIDAECELLDEKENVHKLQQELEAQVCVVLLLLMIIILRCYTIMLEYCCL